MSPCFRFDSSPFSYCRQWSRSVVSLLTSHWTITPLSNGPTFITLIYCASCPPPDPGKQSPLSPQISCLDFRGLWQVLNFDLIED
ncbi:hypothetical protein CBS11852_9808 [Aspergillus niger]|nr:hypothetical protein CBS11852_9808 [Aspergillus niger]